MNRSKRLCALIGVLAAASAATFAVTRIEDKKEQIKTSGEVVLEIDPESVDTLSWTCDGTTLAFHKNEGGAWIYDEDKAFPVDPDKIQTLLEQFEAFSAAFTIENAEDLSQYGLDSPTCTITLTAGDDSYTIDLGSYSTMDEQRYVSDGDGNVYLAASDPLEEYDAGLSDLILNDETPGVSEVSKLTFSGTSDYTVFYEKDSASTYCADDVYFTEQSGVTLPLDTSSVTAYLSEINGLDLTDYVTYNATDEELASYGLDKPELTVTEVYTEENEDDKEEEKTFVLHISRDPKELEKAEKEATDNDSADASGEASEEEDSEDITAYARVGESHIVYRISGDAYQALTAASYDDLRHTDLLSMDLTDVTRIDISLDGSDYTLTSETKKKEQTWSYQEEEIDFANLKSALQSLTADSFTTETPGSNPEEISLTLHLDNENFPEVTLSLYRYDGNDCLALLDGKPVALVKRAQAVDIMEAVRAIVLN